MKIFRACAIMVGIGLICYGLLLAIDFENDKFDDTNNTNTTNNTLENVDNAVNPPIETPEEEEKEDISEDESIAKILYKELIDNTFTAIKHVQMAEKTYYLRDYDTFYLIQLGSDEESFKNGCLRTKDYSLYNLAYAYVGIIAWRDGTRSYYFMSGDKSGAGLNLKSEYMIGLIPEIEQVPDFSEIYNEKRNITYSTTVEKETITPEGEIILPLSKELQEAVKKATYTYYDTIRVINYDGEKCIYR